MEHNICISNAILIYLLHCFQVYMIKCIEIWGEENMLFILFYLHINKQWWNRLHKLIWGIKKWFDRGVEMSLRNKREMGIS